VAVLGVVSALLISVLQRRRELGLLRAVGATRGQVFRAVVAEALLMAAAGTLVGLAGGLPLEWVTGRRVLFEETGFLFSVRVPWGAAVIVTAVSLAGAAVAGLGPALYAARLRIAEAVSYE